MKKHNCRKLIEEALGCSICSNLIRGLRGDELDKAIKQTNWIILEQKREIEELKLNAKEWEDEARTLRDTIAYLESKLINSYEKEN